MSTDLEFQQELPKLRITTISTIDPATETPISGWDGGDDDCRTPTSTENKIPAILSCPPAPKKPSRAAISCKRKLCELDLFEVVAREEVESFFASVIDADLSPVMKRRCPCT